MAHEIEIIDGVAQHVYVGETPWHGLGKRVPADLSPEQMLKTAGLDWTVNKVPMYYDAGHGQVQTNSQALIRSSDNKLLTVVSDSWNPVQNHEAFDFFNDFVTAGDMQMHTAGSLKNGQIVWALAKINDSFELFGGDKVEGYLLFSNPHQFGRSIDIRFTSIRVVCNNTLTYALEETGKHAVRINHRSKFNSDQVKDTLGIAHNKLSTYRQQAELLGSKRWNIETLDDYFQKVFPSNRKDERASRHAEEAMSIIHTQPGANFAEGSWWQALQTVTYMVDHVVGRSQDSRLTSAWYGGNKNRKEFALDLAIHQAEMA